MARRFEATRRVRLGDVTVEGRLRLDALARYLQDVAYDDAIDAGLGEDAGMWVIRSTELTINDPKAMPIFGDEFHMTTWCGTASSVWAERRTLVEPGRIESSTVWVFIDVAGRPNRLPPSFHAAYAESIEEGRPVNARLVLPDPDPDPDPDRNTRRRPWPIRTADHDLLGHVNNAIYWAAIEDATADAQPPRHTRLEFRKPIDAGTEAVDLVTARGDDGALHAWLIGQPADGNQNQNKVHAAAKATMT